MELAPIIDQYYDEFIANHRDTLLPGHLKALNPTTLLKQFSA